MMPTVSVIIPCYGVECYLGSIFADLSKQTFKDSEFIFINDGGSNTIDEMIAEFAKIDKRVISVRQKNGGVSSARNHGLELANGKWVVFVDPDDRLEDFYLESLVSSVENTEAELGIGGFKQYFVKEKRTKSYSIDSHEKVVSISKALIITPPLNVPWNKIYSHKLLKENGFKFPKGITYLEDEHFNLQVYQKVHKVGIVADCGYRYMMYDANSALSKYHANLKENMLISENLRWRLLNSLGKDESEFHQMQINGIGLKLYILIINLFKKGTPLSFGDTVRYIKNEILNDSTMMELFKKHNSKNDKTLVKISNILVASKCPLLIAVVFKTMFYLKYHLGK